MQVFLTVISGVAVFAISQLFMKLVLEPASNQRAAIAEIAHRLIYYADIYSNPSVVTPEARLEASQKLREASSRLQAATWQVWKYAHWEEIGLVPERASIDRACSELIGLSNTTGFTPDHARQRSERVDSITRLLGIPRMS